MRDETETEVVYDRFLREVERRETQLDAIITQLQRINFNLERIDTKLTKVILAVMKG
jgi:hypothetical protein